MLPEPLQVELSHEVRRLLELIAEAGVIASTPEEVAVYFITREIDDLLRSGAIKLGGAE
jgi:hypothetical protein